MKNQNAIYIMTNQRNTTFYVGVTNNILRRVYEHKTKVKEGFTSKYKLNKLVYFELTTCMEDALNREKQIKNWKWSWKVDLITKINPTFEDLSAEIGLNDDVINALYFDKQTRF